jgi:signal transduction histidine kinase
LRDFLATLVHELRTPLTALRGSLGLLSGALPDDGGDARSFTAIAERNAAKLAGLLDDLAAYARLLQPEAAAAARSVDLALLLEQAVDRVEAVVAERGVSVAVAPPEGNLTGDAEMLCDAVTRLLRYAVRVTPRNGRVRVGAAVAAEEAVIDVADEGRPVQEEHASLVLEPFGAVARRGVDAADRPGLDLAIAKLVAERHGGSLTFRQAAEGGVFRMTIRSGDRKSGIGDRRPSDAPGTP